MTRLLLVSALISYICYVQGQSLCTTPNAQSGVCIALKECSSLIGILTNANRNEADIKLLRDSLCGYTSTNSPMVCCPSQNSDPGVDLRCFTPHAQDGICDDILKCPAIVKLLSPPITTENLQFVRNSRCENANVQNSVCCGPGPTTVTAPSRACAPTAAPPDPRTECCGLDGSSGNKIFGGNATAIDQYPWLTIIEYKGVRDEKIKLLCGGALISGKYVLTAAHCVLGPVLRIAEPKNVRLGDYNINNDGPDCVDVEGGGQDCTEGAIVVPIEKIIPHRGYDPNSPLRRHDIALLRLQTMAPYGDFIRPICLPTADVALADPRPLLYAAGWGAVSDQQSSSSVKLHVDLPFFTQTECQPSYNVAKRKVELWNGQICAGGQKGKDSCKGDSGGPLMLDNGRLYEVVGVVSFGPTPCGMENVPGVYTKVYEYMPWIRSQMKP
ncbi:phenoloxidase-activating enzyme [Bicyclus anynana]|uniref:CLIP domain-containing serine protease n=1 Tax=Bicyclus anynana TaxID=110368 RepID=A0A6J1P287_BICAN|nr:phenoloxidase-activating enzyme [Bicyclus anynana]